MNKQIADMQKMEIYADSQKSYKLAKSKFVEMKGNIVKKIGDYKKELILLKQEISDFSQNSTSLFSSLEKELENTRIAQLNNEKDQFNTQINEIKLMQERLLSKFQKDESDSAHNIEQY